MKYSEDTKQVITALQQIIEKYQWTTYDTPDNEDLSTLLFNFGPYLVKHKNRNIVNELRYYQFTLLKTNKKSEQPIIGIIDAICGAAILYNQQKSIL